MSAYRYEWELPILLVTIAAVLGLLVVAALLTQCIFPVVALATIAIGYFNIRRYYEVVTASGIPLSRFPTLQTLFEQSVRRMEAPETTMVVLPSDQANAFTFGLQQPNVLVVHTRLLEIMDEREMRFVLGHELAHGQLGHTWLNTILGHMGRMSVNGFMAIIYALILTWWNRACEYSCDRGGLLACSSLDKAISALIKLSANNAVTAEQLSAAYAELDKQDDTLAGNLAEVFAGHPMIIKRINQLREFSRSDLYARLNARAQSNLPLAV